MKNKKGLATLGLIGLVIAGVLFLVLIMGLVMGQGFVMPSGSSSQKQKVVCDVTIKDSIIGSPKIEMYNCVSEGSCMFSLSAQPLSLFSNKGWLRLKMGSATDKKEFSTFKLGGTEKLTLRVCTPEITGSLTLFDDDNNAIETKRVEI